MEQLRTTWTDEETARHSGAPPTTGEADTVDRFPPETLATGEDHRAGTEESTESPAVRHEGGTLPPDPPAFSGGTGQGTSAHGARS